MARNSTVSSTTGEIALPKRAGSEEHSKYREVVGVVFALIALFWILSLLSYKGLAPDHTLIENGNLVGPAGAHSAFFTVSLFGLATYLINAFMWLLAFGLIFGRTKQVPAKGALGLLVVAFLSSIAVHTMLGGKLVMGGHPAGGFFGQLLGEILISMVSTAGTYIISIGGMIIVLMLVTDISLSSVCRIAGSLLAKGVKIAAAFFVGVVQTWKAASEPAALKEPFISEWKLPPDYQPNDQDKEKSDKENELGSIKLVEPKIVLKKVAKKIKAKVVENLPAKASLFQLPQISMLKEAPEEKEKKNTIDKQHLKEVSELLVKILADFGVFGEVKEIHPGPVVTMFEFQPRSGTKLSKIEGLSNELAMALEVFTVRVVAPIPGKNAVGFELPNRSREMVYLREMLMDEGFANQKLKLPLALGKEISGAPCFVDLSKMPHLLIAGTTGSGKSVSLNTMLVSLLYKYTPDDLRLLMVDPKMIELGTYDGIPHLLLPVVTDMSKACLTLKWAVNEMDRRYQLFADKEVRNIDSYNRKFLNPCEPSEKCEEPAPAIEEIPEVFDAESTDAASAPVVEEAARPALKHEKLPFIVIVIDELADLMMVSAKDVETSITRLSAKARAAGIHLIIATQRPSVDVITGLIKANFPCRISFRVSSGHDSRTILGTDGAENLLGQGDMLAILPSTPGLTRIHGAFVEDDSIRDVVTFLKTQGSPDYRDEILKPTDDEEQDDAYGDEKDEVYDQAVAIVADSQVCSISMLQRRLRIGYNRSARIVEIMEKEGVVGPANNVNKREVLISPH